MAHGRTGPDIVMNTRYAGVSEIRSVSEHEKNRTPDGASAIDPDRSELNRLLWALGAEPEPGAPDLRPKTQQEALEALLASGVKKPAQQSEKPFVQIVLSASPEYFRDESQEPGEWSQQKLDRWVEKTMKWLRKEYGEDLIHASLHLDEDTPHIHVLIAPTYEKKPRKPGRRKRNETEEEFEARKAAVEQAPTVRVCGRASNAYWKRAWARREARKSYHAAVEPLGIGYGRDFVGESEPSPEHVPTGTFVRQKAQELTEREVELERRESAIQSRERESEADRQILLQTLEAAESELSAAKEFRAKVNNIGRRILESVKSVAKALGVGSRVRDIEQAVKAMSQLEEPNTPDKPMTATATPKHDAASLIDRVIDDSAPEEPSEDSEERNDGPGF